MYSRGVPSRRQHGPAAVRMCVVCVLVAWATAGCQGGGALRLASTPTGSRAVSSEPKREEAGSLSDRSRDDWANVGPIGGKLDPMGQITRVTVHHSGTTNDLVTESEIIDYLRRVRTSQCRSKSDHGLGAGDLSYHFVIDRKGVTWEGRSLRYQGAHAGNSVANRGNVGICLLGNFNVQYPNDAQVTALRELLVKLRGRYGLSDRDIYTHREIRAYYKLSGTECPGTHLQSTVETMRLGLRAGAK